MTRHRISPATLTALAESLDDDGRIDAETVARVIAEHEPGARRTVQRDDDATFADEFEARFGLKAVV
jgi:hypothetical protein